MFHIRRQKNTYRYSVAGWSRVHILALLCSEVYGNISLCSYGSSSTRERGGLIGNSSTTTGTHDMFSGGLDVYVYQRDYMGCLPDNTPLQSTSHTIPGRHF